MPKATGVFFLFSLVVVEAPVQARWRSHEKEGCAISSLSEDGLRGSCVGQAVAFSLHALLSSLCQLNRSSGTQRMP